MAQKSIDVKDLKQGQKIRYGLFILAFEGVDEKGHVLLKDSDGEIRNIFEELFSKHAAIIAE